MRDKKTLATLRPTPPWQKEVTQRMQAMNAIVTAEQWHATIGTCHSEIKRTTVTNKRSSAKATAGAMSPFDLQDVNMFLLMGKCYEGY